MSAAGGIERVISKHIGFLIEQNEVILITKDAGESFYDIPEEIRCEKLHIDVIFNMASRIKRIVKILFTFLKTILKLKRKIILHKPDIIYVASPLSLLEVFVAQLNCKNVLLTEHASYSAYNPVYKLIVRVLYKYVGLLTVPTKDVSNFYKLKGIKNIYLPNPLSFYPEKTSKLDDKIVLNVGRFTDDKRHELLINLWFLTKGKSDGWILKIIGKGENDAKLRTLISKLNLEDSVFLLPPTKEIEKAYYSASIFLLTSRTEGFGLVLTEAMSSGVPCIAFNCPSGPKDIINDSTSGYLINEGDHQSFVYKLDKLMSDNNLRKSLGSQARIDIKQFDEINICKKLNRLVLKHF